MFQRNIRKKKGISPVISTIILIVVALVIALLVGVFAFGLFTSQTKSISLQSANLYVAGDTFNFVLKNPGASATIATTAVVITGPSGGGAGTCPTLATTLNAGAPTSLSCTTSGTLLAGNTFDYVITLNNGQSISGSVVSQ